MRRYAIVIENSKMKIIWLCSMSQQEQVRNRHRVQIDLVVDLFILIEYILDAYIVYNDNVYLTLQIRFFANFFRSFFVTFQCFTRLLVANFKHNDLFKITSYYQYIFS